MALFRPAFAILPLFMWLDPADHKYRATGNSTRELPGSARLAPYRRRRLRPRACCLQRGDRVPPVCALPVRDLLE